METELAIAITGTVIGALGFVFGVYKHLSTRKVARLVYDVSQLADFGVPQTFMQDLTRAPLAISVESVGNKAAENVVLRFKPVAPIDEFNVDPSDQDHRMLDGTLIVKAPKLNPGQKIQLFAFCQGDARTDQIDRLEVSHSEGEAVDKRSRAFSTVSYSSWFGAVEFDALSSSLKITRLGPVKLG